MRVLLKLPQGRPITGQSGSKCEGVSIYTEHHIADIKIQHPSYTARRSKILRDIQQIKSGPKIAANSLLVPILYYKGEVQSWSSSSSAVYVMLRLPPMDSETGGLESSGRRLISLNGKTTMLAFFSFFF